MLTALLLGLVGGADLLRAHLGRRAAVAAVVALWSVVLAAALLGLGAPVLGVIVATVLGAAWLLLTTTAEGRRPPGGLRPAVGLVVAVLLLWVADRSGAALSGPMVDAYLRLSRSGPVPPLDQALMAIGAGVLLLESGNVIVRAALYRELEQPAGSPQKRFSLRARFSRPPAEEVRLPDLRGGQAIGPLERVLVAGLTLTGAIGLAGAVFAAKGIVRFPEISRDGAGGAKAEYFLVGSLVSWAIALACAALVAVA